MTDASVKKKAGSKKDPTKIIVGVAVGVLILIIAGLVILAMQGDSGNRKKRIQSITLLPPPPPKVQEKPPEPEVKKEEVVEEIPEPEEQDQPEESPDETKAIDDQLGVDSDASGADGFGLRAKKGGRSILSGDGSDGQFRWYTAMVQKEISDRVRDHLEKNGGIPEGELKALVRVELDEDGRVVKYALLKSSGNARMDAAILKSLAGAGFDDMPPQDMPRALRFRILSKGKA